MTTALPPKQVAETTTRRIVVTIGGMVTVAPARISEIPVISLCPSVLRLAVEAMAHMMAETEAEIAIAMVATAMVVTVMLVVVAMGIEMRGTGMMRKAEAKVTPGAREKIKAEAMAGAKAMTKAKAMTGVAMMIMGESNLLIAAEMIDVTAGMMIGVMTTAVARKMTAAARMKIGGAVMMRRGSEMMGHEERSVGRKTTGVGRKK